MVNMDYQPNRTYCHRGGAILACIGGIILMRLIEVEKPPSDLVAPSPGVDPGHQHPLLSSS